MKETFFHEQLQFSRSFKVRIDEALAEIGLFHSQWLVLFTINKSITASLVEISNYLDVEKPTITRTVSRLEEHGFIETIASEDKRERRVQLTEKGATTFKNGQKIIEQFETGILAEFSEEDLRMTQNLMQQLKQKLQKEGL